jgi:hypothetical protein
VQQEQEDNMDFLRVLESGEEFFLEEDLHDLIEELEKDELDEDALDRITQRVTQREVAYYSFLVGKQNALKAKLCVDKMQQGATVPTSIAKGYLPAVDMIHDIVKAGPSYINLLKSLHQRAKKASN